MNVLCKSRFVLCKSCFGKINENGFAIDGGQAVADRLDAAVKAHITGPKWVHADGCPCLKGEKCTCGFVPPVAP